MAFSREQARVLAGLTDKQLRYWDETQFFSPRFVDRDLRGPYRMAYTFRDVVSLRTIAKLRRHISLQELRKVGEYLCERYESPWATQSFSIAGGRVYFDAPGSGALVQARAPGQIAMRIEMQTIVDEVNGAVEKMRARGPERVGKVAKTRYVMHNASVLEGTRIPTGAVWDFHEAGYDTDAILREYPTLSPEDVSAAIEFERARREQKKRAG